MEGFVPGDPKVLQLTYWWCMSYFKVVPIKKNQAGWHHAFSLNKIGEQSNVSTCFFVPSLAESLEVAAATFIEQHNYLPLMLVEQTKFGKLGFLA